LVIYFIGSQGGSIIDLIASLGTPYGCNLRGESLTSSTKVFQIFATFFLTLKLG
jgi:hypothetical protein